MRSDNSTYRRIVSILLWLVLAGATWGVGLTLKSGSGDDNSFYLTVCMLTIAELLGCLYFIWMSDGSVKQRNLPLQMGGSVMFALYLVVVVALIILAVVGVAFKWLLVGHVGALLLLIAGWCVVTFATKHAKALDKKDKRQLAPFIALRSRYEDFCHFLDTNPNVVQEDVRKKALYIRDEIFRYARSDTVSGLEAVDRDVDDAIASLEMAFKHDKTSEVPGVSVLVNTGLDKLQLVLRRRESRLANAR